MSFRRPWRGMEWCSPGTATIGKRCRRFGWRTMSFICAVSGSSTASRRRRVVDGAFAPEAAASHAELRAATAKKDQQRPSRKTFDDHPAFLQSSAAVRLANLLPLALSCVAICATAQPTNTTRALSLRESIDLALRNNLDLQIERGNTDIARFGAQGAYGGYDPT